MSEKCPFCGKSFENTKALGSHIHYSHETEIWASLSQKRSDSKKEQFQKLLDSCLTDRGLRRPRQVDKVEQAIIEIPEGVSPIIDKYRQAYRCAINKEEIVREIEEELRREESVGETK